MEQKLIPKEYTLRIKEIIDEAPDVKTFRVEMPSDVSFLPGQFFMVRFEDSKVLKRAYSIASSPLEKEHMDITMNLVGEFTGKLWKCTVGDNLVFHGPFGKFYFSEEMSQNLLLIGGGLGITPLMSMMRYCSDKKLGNKINLIYSVKTPEEIVYKKELEEVSRENPNVRKTITITRPNGNEWKGRVGRVDKKLLQENIEDAENTLVYLCGSLEFAKNMIAMLEEAGIRKEQIKTDIWG